MQRDMLTELKVLWGEKRGQIKKVKERRESHHVTSSIEEADREESLHFFMEIKNVISDSHEYKYRCK